MQLADKIGQMLMVGFHGLQAPPYILDWLAEGRIGGVILFARNVHTPQQVAELCATIHQTAKYPALIGIDQEGGAVARLRDGFTESPGAMALAATGDDVLTEQVSQVLGAEMAALGINWVYAPAVDISYNKDNPTVGVRSFGSDSETVSQFAAAAVRGFQRAGVAACAKHFPGLGDTDIDTHLALAHISKPVEQLIANDLIPYQATIANDLASVMTTHTVFEALDSDHPATLSPVVIQTMLRERLHFDKVVTTDCMEMKAIADNYGAGESAVLAMLAGVDIVLFSHTRSMQSEAYNAMLTAAQTGRVPLSLIDKANERITHMKAHYTAAQPDIASIRDQQHLETVARAARAAIVRHKDEGLLPLDTAQRIGLIEFASYLDSEVVEQGGLTGLADYFKQSVPTARTVAIRVGVDDKATLTRAEKLASECDILIVATRNAHLFEAERTLANAYLAEGKQTILLALRNPYDAGVLHADTILCTLGDAAPSLEAVVDALLGKFAPSGTLPVPLK